MKFTIKILLLVTLLPAGLPAGVMAQSLDLLDLQVTANASSGVAGSPLPITYSITNNRPTAHSGAVLFSALPPGFAYVANSGRRDGSAQSPVIDNGVLSFNVGNVASGETVSFSVVALVGAANSAATYSIYAQLFNSSGQAISPEVAARQRLKTDPAFDCSDIIGKVFNDANINGYQDAGEHGIANVRLAAVQGLEVTTDGFGRFHITCPQMAQVQRGSNFILKVDTRSLPTGFRMTTENPRVKRITQGRTSKFEFGAAVHRVVRLDLASAAFTKSRRELTTVRLQALDGLIDALKEKPSILRVAYRAQSESEALADNRVQWVRREIERRWRRENCCYDLVIETETFWQSGAPPIWGAQMELRP